MSDKLSQQIATLEKLLKKPENKQCADCKRNSPSWASISIGVFICIKCSGFHREIGTDYSKVKSVNLDLWPPGAVNNFLKLNNKVVNLYWEHNLVQMNYEKLRNDENRLGQFIVDKYKRRQFINTKHKDPMSLILEGKNPVDEYGEEESLTNAKETQHEEVKSHHKKKNFKLDKPKPSEPIPQPLTQSLNTKNECLIDFTVQEDNAFHPVEEEPATIIPTQNKQYGFGFINKGKEVSISNNEDLIDLNSYETQKDKQLQLLTDNITKAYANPTSQQPNSFYSNCVNHPNPQQMYQGINGSCHVNNSNQGNMFNQQPNGLYGQNNFSSISIQDKLNSLNHQGNSIPNGMNPQYNHMNMNYNQSFYNKQPFNQSNYGIDLYNPNPTPSNYGLVNPTSFNSSSFNSSSGETNRNTKTKEDPFKNLVSFK